jgi:bifunctional non-homologous end joining protein LigD
MTRRLRAAHASEALVQICSIRITHPNRVVYPAFGLTKQQLAAFYVSIADWILPHVRSRPTSLVRCPEGVAEPCFYQKHTGIWAPAALRRVRIQEKKKVGEYLVVDDVEGLIGLVQIGILEIHTWNATAERLEQPDRLAELGLASFVKTSGSKGLHGVAPIMPGPSWAEAFMFSRVVAERLAQSMPARFTTDMAKAERPGRIFTRISQMTAPRDDAGA